LIFFFSSRRRHTRFSRDWSSDVCSSDLGPMTLPANKEVVLKNIKGNAMEIMAEIDVKDAPAFEINVLRSPKKEEYTRIVFYRDQIGRASCRERVESSVVAVSVIS